MNAVNIEYYNYYNGSYNCYYRKIIIFTMVYMWTIAWVRETRQYYSDDDVN